MFGVESISHFKIIPADLKRIYAEHLSIKEHSNQDLLSPYMIKKWSDVLSIYMDKSPSEIMPLLVELSNAYQRQDMVQCLNTINQFNEFPGYPFIVSGTLLEHMRFVDNYFRSVSEKVLPKVPYIAFQKTASSYVSVVLCELLDIPPSSLSFDHITGVRAWVNAFARWGGVTHDHYFPSDENLELLRAAGITKVMIHHRHPVDVLISFAYHLVDHHSNISKHALGDADFRLSKVRELIDSEMESLIRYQGEWTRRWRHQAESGDMEILNTHYEEMKANPTSFFQNIIEFMHIPCSSSQLTTVLAKLKPKASTKSFNYRKATANEWREVLTEPQIDKVKRLVSGEFPDLYF